MARPELYTLFAGLVSYPDQNYRELLKQCRAQLDYSRVSSFSPGNDMQNEDRALSQAAPELFALVATLESFTREELEELYTRTFDINPIASLEIGWHLYGEAYERGSFLVTMRKLLRRFEIPESTELSDHLSNVLKVLGAMEPAEANMFCTQYLLPALTKIVEAFTSSNNPFEHLLAALKVFLEKQTTVGAESHA